MIMITMVITLMMDNDEDDEDDKLGAVWQAHALTTDENYNYDLIRWRSY